MADLQNIQTEAVRLHQRAGGLPGQPPIDVAELVGNVFKKVYVGVADLGAVEAALVTQMGKAAFYYRQQDSFVTRNFALAHLVWHYIRQSRKGQLDLTRQCIIGRPRPADDPYINDERDADIFATELLVPLDLLEGSVDFSPNPQNASERAILKEKSAALAETFGVPGDVMSRRLAVFAARRRPRL